jgi:tetratricopeptide (TPR) repeat protein
VEVEFNQALLLEAQGDFRGAIRTLGQLAGNLNHSTTDSQQPAEARSRGVILERLGILYRQTEAFGEANEIFRQMLELGEEEAKRAYAQIMETHRQARDLASAQRVAEQALERFPEERGLALQRASLLGEQGEVETAVQQVRGLLNGTAEDRQTYLSLAQIYQANKRWADAEAAVAEAEKISGSEDDREFIHFLRGALWERQKRYLQAEVEFRKVLELNPNSAVTLNYLGYMFADRNLRLEESVALVEKALALDPYNGAYLDSLGWAYFRLKKYDQAEEYLLKAVERISRDPTIHEHLGDLYYETKRLPLAVESWERSLEEWKRVPVTEFDPEIVARIESRITQLKTRLAQEAKKPIAKP